MSDPRLSIAHVLTSVHMGGAERVALLLAGDQVRAGHRVAVVSLEEMPEGVLEHDFRAAGVTVRRIPKRQGFDATLPPRLWRTLRGEQVDVVHTHNPLPLTYAAPAGRVAGARVIHTKHGSHPDLPHRLWLRRMGARAVNEFVAVSAATAEFALSINEVAPDKLHVVINAADLDRFTPKAERRRLARSRWGVDVEGWVIGTVGRMVPVKNHALLVRAAAPLLGPKVRLVVVGGGVELDRARELSTKLGVAPFVHLPGELHDSAEAMAGFDVFALSSNSEGLPLVLAEAMATALPVVATAVGGVPGVVEEGKTGYLVPAGDEAALRRRLVQLQAERAHAVEIGRNARCVAEEYFSVGRMSREYMMLYHNASHDIYSNTCHTRFRSKPSSPR